VREQSIALFDAALAQGGIADDARKVLAPALWMLHLGVLLYFIHDRSPRQKRTRRLVDDINGLAAFALPFLGNSAARPLLQRADAIMRSAGLLAS
jgi:hypothetical protein